LLDGVTPTIGGIMSTKLIVYRRVSTARQGESGLGLEAQEASVEGYAKGIGAEIIRTFTEVESGKRSDRPQLAKALAACRREKARLCIAKLDRLSRSVHFLSGLLKTGVDFVCVEYPNADKLMLHMLAVFAEEEARQISVRTKAALLAYKARGGLLGAARPNGHKLTGPGKNAAKRAGEASRRNADDAYADLQETLIEMRRSGLSFRAIARQLNDQGERTRQGCLWNAMQVRRVISRQLPDHAGSLLA
jgi:DNA invertase Pin-like site-specific DNA recombinase